MNGVDGLVSALRRAVKHKSIPGAEKGIIEGKNVRIGNRAYPFSLAVDVTTDEGQSVWVQRTGNGRAVIVGN